MTTTTPPPLAQWRACWDSQLHIAVIHGPDAGWAAPLGPERDVVVGRAEQAQLRIADPGLDREHLRISLRGDGAEVRASRRAAVAVLRRRRRPSRRRGAWHRPRTVARCARLRAGDRVLAAQTLLELRGAPARAPDSAAALPARARGAREPREPREPRDTRDTRESTGDARAGRRGLVLLPALAALVLVGVLLARGAPIYLAIGLLLAAVTTATSLLGGRSARQLAPHPLPRDPAAVAVLTAGLGRAAGALLTAPAPPDAPGNAAGSGSRVGHSDVDGGSQPPRVLTIGPAGVLVTAADGSDPSEQRRAAGLARWIAAQLLLHAPPGEPPRHRGPPSAGARATPGVAVWPAGRLPPPTPHSVLSRSGDDGVSAAWTAAFRAALGADEQPADLRELLGRPTAREIAATWEDQGGGGLAVQLGPGEAGWFDLAADGPHALVAGTTGSGKSELLQGWVLALACRHPPSEVSFLLVDYKGGSTFTHAARIPHCVGLLTDLDPAGSRRALSALRHELRRRERLLSDAGARDRASFLATGGRMSRLIVVVDELRALVEDDDERLADLVAVATLGRSLGLHLVLATQRPGGVVSGQLRANLTLRVCLRVLEAADALDVVADPRPASFADPGRALRGNGQECQLGWLPGAAAAALTDAILAAARRVGRRRRRDLLESRRPWHGPLPETPAPGSAPGPILLDRPAVPAHEPWLPDAGHLLVSGPPRSGRTTALRAVANALTSAAAPPAGCHVLSRAGWGDPSWGTVGRCDQPDVLAHLLTHLAGGGDPAALVAIDDVDHVVAAIDDVLGPGAGQELLAALLTAPRTGQVLIAATTPHRWAASVAHHLALGVRDPGGAAMLGVHREFVEPRPLPGRGVLLSDGTQALAQVVPPAPAAVFGPAPAGPGVLRLCALPDVVRGPDLGTGGSGGLRVPLGIGLGGVVEVAVPERGALVIVGPPGSGRSTALARIAAGLTANGLHAARAAPEGADAAGSDPERDVLLIDDADLLAPAQVEALLPRVGRRCVLVTSPASLTTDFRGLVAAARESGRFLALGGYAPGRTRPPHGPPRPGRGVLIDPAGAWHVQVADVGDAGPAADAAGAGDIAVAAPGAPP